MQILCDSSNETPKLNLSTVRNLRGYTLTEVAKRINVSAKTLSKYERKPDEIPLNVAVKLIKLYRCDFSMVQFQNEAN